MTQKKDITNIENLFLGNGLNESEVLKKRQEFGYNEIPEKKDSFIKSILKRMWGPIPWLLEAAMIFELFLGKIIQAIIVFILLVFSAVIGAVQENRAKKAIGFLHQQLQIKIRTLRNNEWKTILSKELVPGDIVHVRLGDIVPADIEIIFGNVSVNESVLTGESMDVIKEEGDTIFSGSTISHGEVIARVKATGKNSTYGKTAELVRTAEAPGRLQKLLFTIVRYLAYLDIILAIILIVAAVFQGTPWQELLPFLAILFIATIPISMPSSFVVANSLEAKNLATDDVLVTGLTGIQEAASMDILLIDKTGTLTNNHPEIAEIVSFGKFQSDEILKLAAVASDSTSNDTISKAILKAAYDKNLQLPERISFIAFDPIHKVSRAQINKDGKKLNIIMGSPNILEKQASIPSNFWEQVNLQSEKGSRVLALALGEEDKLECQGLIALAYTPRVDAKESIAKIKELGIRIIMLTGDTVGTAKAIARQVGLGDNIGTIDEALTNPLNFDGIANVYPEDKYKIVKSLQDLGLVVGMTGDGINDAPALKQADVGIAVSTATDVAKSAARVVLTKPQLSDITKIIDAGHRVYRRMMTWTITKLSRTAELAALLTFGFILTGFFPVSLSLIVFIIVMNDMVTLTLGSDNAWPTSVPEKWDLNKLSKISAIFTIGWLFIGMGILWFYLKIQHLSAGQISSLMFLYLIYSAMETVLMTRTRDEFWSFKPNKWVIGTIIANIILATIMATFGIFMSPVSLKSIILLFVITIFSMLLLDYLKIKYYKSTKILGSERHL